MLADLIALAKGIIEILALLAFLAAWALWAGFLT